MSNVPSETPKDVASQPASAATPVQTPPSPASAKKPSKSAAAIIAFVLSIVALAFSFVPFINNVAFILAIIALIFAIVGIVGAKKGKKTGKGLAIAALILAIISGAAVLASQAALSASIDRMSGEATEQVLGTDADVALGDFHMKKDEYGLIESELPVTVTNLTDEPASFDVQIEAVDASGNRIEEGYVYASDLGPGQSQTFDTFTLITSEDYEAMKQATFNIVSVGVI